MVSSQFEAILKEFESFFKCQLKPDSNHSCLIQLKDSISIQIELYKEDQSLVVGCRLGELPFGKNRLPILESALKSNELTLPSTGVFGISQKSNQLILFLFMDPKHVTEDEVAEILPPYLEKAKKWAEALAKGETPVVESQQVGSGLAGGGMFGL